MNFLTVFIERNYLFIRKKLVQGKKADEVISIVYKNNASKVEPKPQTEIYAVMQEEKNVADKPHEAS